HRAARRRAAYARYPRIPELYSRHDRFAGGGGALAAGRGRCPGVPWRSEAFLPQSAGGQGVPGDFRRVLRSIARLPERRSAGGPYAALLGWSLPEQLRAGTPALRSSTTVRRGAAAAHVHAAAVRELDTAGTGARRTVLCLEAVDDDLGAGRQGITGP